MANPPSMQDYNKTGFYSSANIAALQEQLAKYQRPDADLKADAASHYTPEYNAQRQTYQNQLSELNMSRDRDMKKLNAQYDKSLNQTMAGLSARNMGRSSLVSTQGVANENARNAAASETSYQYLQQQNQINANMQQLDAQHAQNIENKYVEMKRENQSQYINLMAQIAQLQQNGYSAYAEYLLNK